MIFFCNDEIVSLIFAFFLAGYLEIFQDLKFSWLEYRSKPNSESIIMSSWYVESLFDFQYFVCPSCDFKHNSKQEFVTHALETHSESFLKNCIPNVRDESLNDVNFNEVVDTNSHENQDIEKFVDITDVEKETLKSVISNDEKDIFEEVKDEAVNDDQAPTFKDYGDTIIISTEHENADDEHENFNDENESQNYIQGAKEEKSDVLDVKENIPIVSESKKPKLEQVENNDEPITCNLCSARFVARSYLKMHMKMLHENATYKCQFCKVPLRTLAQLKSHMKMKHNKKEKFYKCSLCIDSFHTEGQMKKHVVRCHNDFGKDYSQRELFICEVCKATYGKQWQLRKHMESHLNTPNIFSLSEY